MAAQASSVNPTWPALAFNGFWDLADATNHVAYNCLDLQRVLWQPWLDLQLAWTQQCAAMAQYPGTAAWMQRGTEQLG